MTIVTRGLGTKTGVIVTWGYGDVVIPIVPSEFIQIVSVSFNKLSGQSSSFKLINEIAADISRTIEEYTTDPIRIPSDGSGIFTTPSVYASFGEYDFVDSLFETSDTKVADMSRVVYENPIVQGNSPSNNIIILPTYSVTYQKSDSIYIEQNILNNLFVKFERVVFEEEI